MNTSPHSSHAAFRFTGFLQLWCALLLVTRISAESPVDFARDVRPIFNKHCTACHGGVKRAGNVSFLLRDLAMSPGKSGAIPVKPGDPDHSEVLRRITTTDADDHMPPAKHGPALAAKDVAVLRDWIRQGAPWSGHWAYAPVREPATPALSPQNASHARQTLDRFVLARLEAEQIAPAPEADRREWLRRASLDLTGLPPTPAEVRAFLADHKQGAHERVADRLLASAHYGERWASMWMDLARYADTMGYEKDPHRNIHPYRDWLIRAFNSDLPYDQFLIKQLAGDLLPDATLEDRLATAFHRNTQTNTEGGTDDEEFRIAAVLDRVNTTWEALQATSFRCVQCHSHPYDGFDHDEYYKFMSYFNTTRDADVDEEFPLLRVPDKQSDFVRAGELDREIASLRRSINDAGLALDSKPGSWIPTPVTRAFSTGSTVLEPQPVDGAPGFVSGGTITTKSRFTLELDAPAEPITAIRLDAFPIDAVKALAIPETGFVVSRFRLTVVSNDVAWPPADKFSGARDKDAGTNAPPGREIRFQLAFDDDPASLMEASDSLKDNDSGFAAYTRLDWARHAVFVPESPICLTPGEHLRVILTFNREATGDIPLVIRRGRISLSRDPAWSDLRDSQQLKARREELAAKREERNRLGGLNVPVMAEQDPAHARSTRVFLRGAWLNKGAEVRPAIPRLFPTPAGGVPVDRLAMARWIASRENPLTARVMVNRIWDQLFGIGLVETVEDFGSTAQPPSHPELLDHLALRFENDLKWSMKSLLRELVLSATYRQSSAIRKELVQKDPANRLLARGPRVRLGAEMIRDQALAVSGLLSDKMFGSPVMPPQPEGIWRSVYNSAKWETSSAGEAHRRAVYTYWKRTSGYPAFLTFDAPSREVCSSRRLRTNTPLQALTTLNDPVFIECAFNIARQMETDRALTSRARIAHAYERVTGRPPTPTTAKALASLRAQALEHYRAHRDLAAELAGTPERSADTAVANAILNLDATLTK